MVGCKPFKMLLTLLLLILSLPDSLPLRIVLILPVSPFPQLISPIPGSPLLLSTGLVAPPSGRPPRMRNFASTALLLTPSSLPSSLYPSGRKFPSLLLPPQFLILAPFPPLTQRLALKHSARTCILTARKDRKTAAQEMNMLAGWKRNRCPLRTRADSLGSIIAGFIMFYCFRSSLVEHTDGFCSVFKNIYMFCLSLWPVSLLWAAQLLMPNGSVSHSGRPRLLKDSRVNLPRLSGSHSSSPGSFVIVFS